MAILKKISLLLFVLQFFFIACSAYEQFREDGSSNVQFITTNNGYYFINLENGKGIFYKKTLSGEPKQINLYGKNWKYSKTANSDELVFVSGNKICSIVSGVLSCFNIDINTDFTLYLLSNKYAMLIPKSNVGVVATNQFYIVNLEEQTVQNYLLGSQIVKVTLFKENLYIFSPAYIYQIGLPIDTVNKSNVYKIPVPDNSDIKNMIYHHDDNNLFILLPNSYDIIKLSPNIPPKVELLGFPQKLKNFIIDENFYYLLTEDGYFITYNLLTGTTSKLKLSASYQVLKKINENIVLYNVGEGISDSNDYLKTYVAIFSIKNDTLKQLSTEASIRKITFTTNGFYLLTDNILYYYSFGNEELLPFNLVSYPYCKNSIGDKYYLITANSDSIYIINGEQREISSVKVPPLSEGSFNCINIEHKLGVFAVILNNVKWDMLINYSDGSFKQFNKRGLYGVVEQ